MDDKAPKVTKTIKLEDDLNNRLNDLCTHLGVTAHSYFILKIGEAISRDEVAFLASKSASDSQAKMNSFFDLMSQEMEKEKAKQGLDFIFFAIVDTKNKTTHLVIFSDAEAELAANAYGATTTDHWMELPGLISRKKQLMPVIQETLSA